MVTDLLNKVLLGTPTVSIRVKNILVSFMESNFREKTNRMFSKVQSVLLVIQSNKNRADQLS